LTGIDIRDMGFWKGGSPFLFLFLFLFLFPLFYFSTFPFFILFILFFGFLQVEILLEQSCLFNLHFNYLIDSLLFVIPFSLWPVLLA